MANDVPTAVFSQTKNLRTRESMLLGAGLEGGWTSPFPVGDHGTSFGPYQLHQGGALTALGLSPAQAENAKTATKAMMPAYQNAVNQISDHLWSSDPESAAEQAAVIAERPAQDYFSTQGRAKVGSVWKNTQNVLAGKTSTGGMPPNAHTTSAGDGTSTASILGNIWSFIDGLLTGNPTQALSPFAPILERIGLIVFGAMLIIVGIIVLALPSTKKAAGEAASLYGTGRRLGAVGGHRGADPAEAARKNAIADRSMALGEKKLALKQQRENRLAGKQDFD